MTEHTTPTPAEVHAILALSLQNSNALKGTPQHRAGVLMDDLSDAGLCIMWKTPPESTDATEHTTPTEHDDSDGDQVTTGISLPCSLGRDQEAREGLQRELWVADVDTTTEPRRVAIDYTTNTSVATPQELGWFDVRTIVRQLAEFAPDLVVIRREDLPEVTITEHMTEPTMCTVDIGGVRRFSGADWTGHAINAQYLRDQLTEARMKLATAESTIEHQRGRIQTLTDACQRKNSDCARYAEERQAAIESHADTTAEMNATLGLLDQERHDHEQTRNELRAMTVHARKWQRFATVIELMEDANQAELIIDGVRITPANGVRTRATKG